MSKKKKKKLFDIRAVVFKACEELIADDSDWSYDCYKIEGPDPAGHFPLFPFAGRTEVDEYDLSYWTPKDRKAWLRSRPPLNGGHKPRVRVRAVTRMI